MSLNNYGP